MNANQPPTAWITTAVIGGLFFILGGIATTLSTGTQIVLIAMAVAFVMLGAYAAIIAVRNAKLRSELEALAGAGDQIRLEDADLRTRMGHMVRDPLTAIVGYADLLVGNESTPFDERQVMLAAIRSNAREVEMVLSELAGITPTPGSGPEGSAVVLLDEEASSVASTIITETPFETNLGAVRAWGDNAQFRQILRTLLTAAAASDCPAVDITGAQKLGRATLTISGTGHLLSDAEASALSDGLAVAEDANPTQEMLIAVHRMARAMGGTVGYVHAFGISHMVLDFPAAEGVDLDADKGFSPRPHGFATPAVSTPTAEPASPFSIRSA